VSWWVVLLAWLGLVNGLAAALTALVALNRVLRPLGEVSRYAEETLEAARGIERHLEGAGEILRTRELVTGLRDAVGAER